MKDTIVQQCLDILKKDDVKNEIKNLLKPFLSVILNELNPYIYAITTLIFLMFIMNFVILIILLLLLRNKHITNKIFIN